MNLYTYPSFHIDFFYYNDTWITAEFQLSNIVTGPVRTEVVADLLDVVRFMVVRRYVAWRLKCSFNGRYTAASNVSWYNTSIKVTKDNASFKKAVNWSYISFSTKMTKNQSFLKSSPLYVSIM